VGLSPGVTHSQPGVSREQQGLQPRRQFTLQSWELLCSSDLVNPWLCCLHRLLLLLRAIVGGW
jgi:hypothetical protein